MVGSLTMMVAVNEQGKERVFNVKARLSMVDKSAYTSSTSSIEELGCGARLLTVMIEHLR